jgi:hypothetical protein
MADRLLARDLLKHALHAREQARGSVADIEREARHAVHEVGEQARTAPSS